MIQTKEAIWKAVEWILDAGTESELPKNVDELRLIGNIMGIITHTFGKHRQLFPDTINRCIEVSNLEKEQCTGYVALDRENPIALFNILHDIIRIGDEFNLDHFGESYDYDVCQSCHAFADAIDQIYRAGYDDDVAIEALYEITQLFWQKYIDGREN